MRIIILTLFLFSCNNKHVIELEKTNTSLIKDNKKYINLLEEKNKYIENLIREKIFFEKEYLICNEELKNEDRCIFYCKSLDDDLN